MKKITMFAIILAGMQSDFFAQGYGSTTSRCTTDAMIAFAGCLRSNGISCTMAYHQGTYYIQAVGNPPPGQIQSCIAHYNSDSGNCPDAPMIVEQTPIAPSRGI